MAYQTGAGVNNLGEDAIAELSRKSTATNLSNVDITKLPPAAQIQLLEAQIAQVKKANEAATTTTTGLVNEAKTTQTEATAAAKETKAQAATIKDEAASTITSYQYTPNNSMRKANFVNGTMGTWEANPDYVKASSPLPGSSATAGSGVINNYYGGSSAPDTSAADAAAAVEKANIAQAAADEKRLQRESIVKIVTDRFAKYNLGSLAQKIRDLAIDGANEATITIALSETKEYQDRFSANADRIKKGIAVLDPGSYLEAEDTYRQVLRANGLKQFDNDAYVKQFIANDTSSTEIASRINTAVNRIQYADPAIKKTLNDYYGLNESDLLGYVLSPDQELPKIQQKITAAEIGTAASVQGLKSNLGVSEQLASQGVTQAEAQKGYANIADFLPTTEKLGNVYNELPGYNQADAEQETFNQLASAQRKRERLRQTELGTFGASSGTSKGSFSTAYLNKQSSTGQF